ncbi:MAG: glycerol-3-phosphate 1-O-acyltransferase PlsY [Burkholderiales bacterium]|nr:glycerol-3-phosphate 1-O-acyltransferase PlsY [Burkholderiales bacterium]
MSTLVFALIAYLIGSISFAVIVSRAFGLPDPRSYGSGNPGATNVLRTGRKAAAVLTLLGDGAKGWLAVFVVQRLVVVQRFGEPEMLDISLAAAAVAVVIGHMYPVFFRFRGGKGVSTALGVLVALDYYLAAGTVATWLIIAFFFRISSLAALISALFAPFFCFLLFGMRPVTIAVIVISLLLVWRHKTNIRNLLAGKESRFGGRSTGSSQN